MLVYRSDDRVGNARDSLGALLRQVEALHHPSHDEVLTAFIEFGEIESAIADRVCPTADAIHPLTSALRVAGIHAGHALIASWRDEPDLRDRSIHRLRECLRTLPQPDIPQTLSTRVSEGYAFYALRPETYVLAAERFIDEQRPTSAVCVGIRSIGCSLSTTVAAALERQRVPTTTYTVRPRGHPFNRNVVLDHSLAQALLSSTPDAHYLIVDEGPGLSGSSFASVVRVLRQLGIRPDRIVLFPSSNPDGLSFHSESARVIWNQHPRYWVSAQDAKCSIEDVTHAKGGVDISAGRWRHTLWPGRDGGPPVQPQHEVVKHWLPEEATIVRFAGLGRYGERKRQRAEILADAGLGPPPLRLESGYLSLPFIRSSAWAEASGPLVDAVAHHCACLTRSFPAQRTPSVDSVFEMIVTNLQEECAGEARLPDLEQYRASLEAAPCCAIDGRMLPHEWLSTDTGFVKVDALDHHQSHFFPGIQDAGWDLAAAAFEFDLDSSGRTRLLDRYVAESKDREVTRRMPFYNIAYVAFRLGYAVMAAESLGETSDGDAFRTVAQRSRERLLQTLALHEE